VIGTVGDTARCRGPPLLRGALPGQASGPPPMAQTTRLGNTDNAMGSFRKCKKGGMRGSLAPATSVRSGVAPVASKSNDKAATYENLAPLHRGACPSSRSQYVDEMPPQGTDYSAIRDPPRSRPAPLLPRPEMYREMQVRRRGASWARSSKSRCATTFSPWSRPSKAHRPTGRLHLRRPHR